MTSLSCFLKDEEKAHRRSAISVYTGAVKEPEGSTDRERVNRYVAFFAIYLGLLFGRNHGI